MNGCLGCLGVAGRDSIEQNLLERQDVRALAEPVDHKVRRRMQRLKCKHHDVVEHRVTGGLNDHAMESNVSVAELLVGQVGSGLPIERCTQRGEMIGCPPLSGKSRAGRFKQASAFGDLGE